jgi:sugar/nucleoside kinase (ribokinase family)
MLTDSPPDALDLVVVGGLTIDRFIDGSSAPGGSVLHIARATAPRGLRLGVITAAGPERSAQSGVEELNRLAAFVAMTHGTASTTFRHSQTAAGRELRMDRRGADPSVGIDAPSRSAARAILFAPVAGEVEAPALARWGAAPRRAAILQGWLRSVGPDGLVRPVPLAAVDASLVLELGQLDLLVASREDLLADGSEPATQLLAMRQAAGDRPTLVVTDGADGLWLGTGGSAVHLAAPWQVHGVSTVGAGDILAAFLLTSLVPEQPAVAAAQHAMRIVAEVLEERKRS